MSDERIFLEGLAENPADRQIRALYADWLEERRDPRAEYLRIEELLESLDPGDARQSHTRARFVELAAELSPDWLVAIRRLQAGPNDDCYRPEVGRQLAVRLGRPVEVVDPDGFTSTIRTAAIRTDRWAWLESRTRVGHVGITHHLRICTAGGGEVEWPPETDDPCNVCRPRYFEWFGTTLLFVYEERHRHYIARIGIDQPFVCEPLEKRWFVEGLELFQAHVTYDRQRQVTLLDDVERIALPMLDKLRLSPRNAERWGLVPRLFQSGRFG